MKSVITILLAFSSLAVFSQATPPNEKAKNFYDKFLKIVEEIKAKEAEKVVVDNKPDNNEAIKGEGKANESGSNGNKKIVLKQLADNAMTQIGHIRKRDPGYDVAQLEAMVKPYIEDLQNDVKANKNRIMTSVFHDSDEGCYGLFKANTTTEFRTTGGDINEDIKQHISQLENYNKRLDNILKSHMDGVEACENKIRSVTEISKKGIAKQKLDAETRDGNDVRIAYRELVGFEAYWNAAKQLYPGMKEAAEVHQQVKNALASLGSMENVMAKANARKAERLKNIFMPKSVITNPAIEAEFKEAFNNGGWSETIIKINILSREWSTIRHSISGAILYRTISAAIVAKQKEGNCIQYHYTIKQQHTGSGFSNISSYSSHNVIEAEFLCENAK